MPDPTRTVLLVDDEDLIRLTLRDYLEGKGYRVLVASDGVGALRHLLDDEPDFIVTDFRMEAFGGDYWVRFLKRYHPQTPTIVMSGFLRPEFPIPYEVIYKPFDYADLEQSIREALA